MESSAGIPGRSGSSACFACAPVSINLFVLVFLRTSGILSTACDRDSYSSNKPVFYFANPGPYLQNCTGMRSTSMHAAAASCSEHRRSAAYDTEVYFAGIWRRRGYTKYWINSPVTKRPQLGSRRPTTATTACAYTESAHLPHRRPPLVQMAA
jgi:hypothetical protein